MMDLVTTLGTLAQSELALALMLCGLTAALVACCVPGTIVPLSVSSGALLGGAEGALVVTAGAVIGSHALFLASRHLLRERIRTRLGARLHKFEGHFARRGLLYVAGMRVVGVPHFLVTAGCALSPLRARTFLAATLLGLLPVIALTSTAGSLV
jgi:uncharacterized membrane protein YdjX (TVP38/TMEM64 family)